MFTRWTFLAAAFSGALLLSACKEEVASHAVYLCPSGLAIDAVFTGGKSVEISVGESSIVLPRVESASGAKYEGEGIVFWSKGRDALYTPVAGGEPITCRRR